MIQLLLLAFLFLTLFIALVKVVWRIPFFGPPTSLAIVCAACIVIFSCNNTLNKISAEYKSEHNPENYKAELIKEVEFTLSHIDKNDFAAKINDLTFYPEHLFSNGVEAHYYINNVTVVNLYRLCFHRTLNKWELVQVEFKLFSYSPFDQVNADQFARIRNTIDKGRG